MKTYTQTTGKNYDEKQVKCSSCGEEFMITNAVCKDGEVRCPLCNGTCNPHVRTTATEKPMERTHE